MNFKITKSQLITAMIIFFLIGLPLVLGYNLPRYTPILKVYPSEKCHVVNDNVICELEPCKKNCIRSFSWKKFSNDIHTLLSKEYVMISPQYKKHIDDIANFCNDDVSNCYLKYSYYEEDVVKIEKDAFQFDLIPFFKLLLFQSNSIEKFIKNFCKIRDHEVEKWSD